MSCDFASIRDAFGVTSFVSPEPPVLRGDVAKIHDTRHKKIDTTIKSSHADSMQPQVGSCFGAGNPSELERCSAGTTHPVCQACARRHSCVGTNAHHKDADTIWSTASPPTKRALAWFAFRDLLESDGLLILAVAVILYLLWKK